jgi:hypothetical protein
MRIIEAVRPENGAGGFATSAALISKTLNINIYKKLNKSYPNRILIAIKLYNRILRKAKKQKWSCYNSMLSLSKSGKVAFSCFYSAYQYRNKFVHQGLPFPNSVKDAWGLEVDSGTAYLYPTEGISLMKIIRPSGIQSGDLIDIHDVIGNKTEAAEFQNEYFKLLPTWHYMKTIVRKLLIDEINNFK